MHQTRVLVTGMGVVSALGNGTNSNLQALRQAASGIGYTRLLQTIYQHTLPVGEVPADNETLRTGLGLPAQSGDYTRTTLLGLTALQEALDQSGIDIARYRTGLINASTVGGMSDVENIYFDLIDPDTQVNGLADTIDCADCTERLAQHFGIKDWLATISTACSSSANAIMFGARLIKKGMLDVAICGGTDALTRFTLNGFNSLKNIDQQHCKPFDANRNGLNLGEAAAYIILVNENTAPANVLAELTGYCNYNEAFHPTAPSPEGEGAYQAMQGAIQMAGLQASDISYVNVHGTATLNNDQSEGMAMKRLFDGQMPAFSSTKPYTGHTLAAAGAVEAVFSILSLQHGEIYPNLNFDTPMPELGLTPTLTWQQNIAVQHVLSNSFGFGGNNASLVFSRYA